MRTAHLILVHKNPRQLERLLKTMAHPNFDFYIHLDKKIDINAYLPISAIPNVFFIKDRVDVKWGGYSIIKATFNGINEICRKDRNYNFINFLSGQDYPIKSIEEIVRFFQDNIGKEFITYKDIINDWKEAQHRYKKYHFTELRFKGSTRLERLVNFFSLERIIPYNLHPYGESMFWTLSPEVALYVVNKVENDKKMESFFYYTWAADEFLFQTIIMNSPYRNRVVNDNYRYIDWSAKKASPKLLGKDDFEKLKTTPMLFARKFDIQEDYEILDRIDSKLL